jgi:ABC-2 type transport system permease protein
MSLRAIGGLTRAAWYQAKSYRLGFASQLGGLVFTVLPIYFVATALQPTMADAISAEANQYFPFILVGWVAAMFMTAGLQTLQTAISGGISTGSFESLLVTRTPVPLVLIGLTSFGTLNALVRASVMVLGAWILGASIVWSQLAPALLLIAMIFVVYWGIGLVAAAMIIAFRSTGLFLNVVNALSIFFGGVYYPVSTIPSWLRSIADVTPMAYGLRALRRVILLGEGFGAVSLDVAILAAMGLLSILIGSLAIAAAIRYARKVGSLGTY